MITSKTFVSAPQVDGTFYVKEIYVDNEGKTYSYDWNGTLENIDLIMEERAEILNKQIQAKKDAIAAVQNTLLPLSHYEFRQLFNDKKELVDEFNEFFESYSYLTEAQKRTIRSGLQDFKMSGAINRPFLPGVLQMLSLYKLLGLITEEDRLRIIAVGNGNG